MKTKAFAALLGLGAVPLLAMHGREGERKAPSPPFVPRPPAEPRPPGMPQGRQAHDLRLQVREKALGRPSALDREFLAEREGKGPLGLLAAGAARDQTPALDREFLAATDCGGSPEGLTLLAGAPAPPLESALAAIDALLDDLERRLRPEGKSAAAQAPVAPVPPSALVPWTAEPMDSPRPEGRPPRHPGPRLLLPRETEIRLADLRQDAAGVPALTLEVPLDLAIPEGRQAQRVLFTNTAGEMLMLLGASAAAGAGASSPAAGVFPVEGGRGGDGPRVFGHPAEVTAEAGCLVEPAATIAIRVSAPGRVAEYRLCAFKDARLVAAIRFRFI